MAGLGQGGDFFGMCNSAAQANIRSHVVDCVTGEQHFKLEDRVKSLPSGDWHAGLGGNLRHCIKVIRQRRVFDEHWIVLFNAAGKHYRFVGSQAAVNLDAQIDVITHRFAASEYAKAFEVIASGQSGKIILDWTHV